MTYSSEMTQNLLYVMYKKINIVFTSFFISSIYQRKSKVAKIGKQKKTMWVFLYISYSKLKCFTETFCWAQTSYFWRMAVRSSSSWDGLNSDKIEILVQSRLLLQLLWFHFCRHKSSAFIESDFSFNRIQWVFFLFYLSKKITWRACNTYLATYMYILYKQKNN